MMMYSLAINSALDNTEVLPWLKGKFEIPTNIVVLADLQVHHLNAVWTPFHIQLQTFIYGQIFYQS